MLILATMRNKISFLEFKDRLKSFPIFSTQDIHKSFPNLHRRRLYEWRNRNLIKPVMRGYYIFSDIDVSEELLYTIANRIYEPSYISLQSALSWHNLIPEFVSQITSVSTKKTTVLATELGSFAYFSVRKELMFGHDLIRKVKMASPEKAVLDLFYLNPSIESEEQFSELRINMEIFREKISMNKLKQYLLLFASKALTKRVTNFVEFMENA